MAPALLAVPALVATALVAVAPAPLAGQERQAQSATARIVAFLNEPREPEFGEIFQLEVQVRVAPDVVVFLSDTMVDAASSVSAGPGTWTVTVGAADSIDIRATYPVMGFLPGGVELPFVELWTRPLEAGEEPGVRPSSELPPSERDGPGVDHALLYLGGVFIMPPSEMIGDDAMLEPRPPADVAGGDVSIWLLGALMLVGVAAAVVAWLLLAPRLGKSSPVVPLLSPEEEALRELDRIHELGWHSNGRVADFYDATTGVLRHYAERRDPSRWRTALTSSELLARLREHWGAAEIEPLGGTVWTAECVKFGGRRPDAEAAEADWARVREWIAREPSGS
jgi:hypothetical protein